MFGGTFLYICMDLPYLDYLISILTTSMFIYTTPIAVAYPDVRLNRLDCFQRTLKYFFRPNRVA